MPYNNTPIAPPQEFTGSVSLPLARVKKIIHADEEIGACSNNAAFAIAVATEMFVQHLVEQSHNVVKSERRPRRNIQYKDVANAVARIDNLEFLADVVPRTMTYKAYKEKKAVKENGTKASDSHISNGQQTLQQMASREREPLDIDMDRANDEQAGHHATNGHIYDLEHISSPERRVGSSNRSAPTRPFYDAVRNGYDRSMDHHAPMEE